MKNFFVGMAVGALTTYVVYKLAKEGKFDCICDDLNKITNQTKKKIKDGLDIVQNNVEYLEDRLKFKSNEIKESIEEIGNKISGKQAGKATS